MLNRNAVLGIGTPLTVLLNRLNHVMLLLGEMNVTLFRVYRSK